jgi:hypothetical protein
MKIKHKIMASALLASAALVVYDQTTYSQEDNGISLPNLSTASTYKTTESVRSNKLSEVRVNVLLSREHFINSSSNIFESPEPPAPLPAIVNEPPPSPKVPELPFIFIGKEFQDGKWQVFLNHGDHIYIIRVGDILEDTYQVTEISPPNLIMIYLPMKEPQTLDIGPTLNE